MIKYQSIQFHSILINHFYFKCYHQVINQITKKGEKYSLYGYLRSELHYRLESRDAYIRARIKDEIVRSSYDQA